MSRGWYIVILVAMAICLQVRSHSTRSRVQPLVVESAPRIRVQPQTRATADPRTPEPSRLPSGSSEPVQNYGATELTNESEFHRESDHEADGGYPPSYEQPQDDQYVPPGEFQDPPVFE